MDIEWREVGTDDWTVINVSKTATTRDELGDTITIPHGAGIVPEVRMRRMSREVDDVQVFDEVRWVRLKSELPGVIDNADVTIITAKIRGTNALSSAAQSQFSTIQVRHLETYEDGEWLPAAATTDIAPVVAYAIKDSGHPDERIALDELEELDGVWKARGDEFNAVFDEDGTLYESLKKVLAVGFAQPVINTGRILPIREAAESYDGLMFSTDNTTSITEEGTLFDPDENDGVTVEYFSNETWLPEYIDCLLPGDAGVNTEAVRAIGITDKTKAYQFGMRYRRSQYYSRVSYTIETEQESKNGNLLEKCRVPSRDTQNGWCEAYDAGLQVLTVNTGLVWTDDEQHYIGVRRPDGSLSGSYACSKVDEFNVLLDEPLAFTPQFDGPLENPLFMFGIADSWSKPARIRSIEPKADGKSTVIASTYDERVFLDDDSVPD